MEEIARRAEAYRQNVYGGTGQNITINHSQIENQVLPNQLLSEFSNAELQEIGYILVHMSRNPGLNAVIENDHFEYWAFVDLLTRNSAADYWVKEHNPFYILLDIDFISRLRREHPESSYTDLVNFRNRNVLLANLSRHPLFPAVWTGFAYLEGVCRRICHSYIGEDGEIKRAFKVNGRQYRTPLGRQRASGRNKGDTRISSLRDILTLTRRLVGSSTRSVLKKFFTDYSAKSIYSWRNGSLHGLEDGTTVIIVQYCLICILLLDYPRT